MIVLRNLSSFHFVFAYYSSYTADILFNVALRLLLFHCGNRQNYFYFTFEQKVDESTIIFLPKHPVQKPLTAGAFIMQILSVELKDFYAAILY